MAATFPWFVELLLAAALPGALGVQQWDCANHPYPVQILKEFGTTQYKTMSLNLIEKTFEQMWTWTQNTASQPTQDMNAMAYNVADGIAYGIFSPDLNTDSYLCRFDHTQNSAECLCKAPGWGNAATITSNGDYYYTNGGPVKYVLQQVQNIPSPASSPADVSTLAPCGMTNLNSGMGTGGAIDVSSAGLTVSMMEAAYGGLSSDCTSSCYMANQGNGHIWTKSGGNMEYWKPGAQTVLDLIDWEYNGRTYLIGLGAYDGSVYMGRVAAGGSALDGYAWSRVVMDYTAAPSGTTMTSFYGFGAG